MKDLGQLDKLVSIRSRVITRSASGAPQEVWNVYRTCYAHLMPRNSFSGGEHYEARQLVEVTEQQWVIRYREEKIPDSAMVLEYGNKVFHIKKVEPYQVKNRTERNAYLLITTFVKDNEDTA